MSNILALSARRAWHDCFYIPQDDVLASMQDSGKGRARKERAPKESGDVYIRDWVRQVKEDIFIDGKRRRVITGSIQLMNDTDQRRKAPDFFESWDPIWRGKVHGAIRALPRHLRSFGMMMYAPTESMDELEVEEACSYLDREFVRSYGKDDLLALSGGMIVRLKIMELAALRNHRGVAWGNLDMNSPSAVGRYMLIYFREKVPVQHWARDYERPWKKMMDILGKMERDALAPVADVLNEMRAAA